MLNVITINGDGVNDGLDFNLMGLDLLAVQIFNRWGSLFKVLYTGFIWDGRTDAGDVVREGVYYWLVISENVNSKGLEKKGYVHVFH